MKKINTLTFIGLGSNLANPIEQIQLAITTLQKLSHSQFLTSSTLYRTKPHIPRPNEVNFPIDTLWKGPQPDFINAVCALKTSLTPDALLYALKEIEAQQGREKDNHYRWGPRKIDLDILLYGKQRLHRKTKIGTLIIPHPGIKTRRFVLIPLLEVAEKLEVNIDWCLPASSCESTMFDIYKKKI